MSSPLAMLLYRTLLWLLTPFLLLRFYREARQFNDDAFFLQRRGHQYPSFQHPPVWFHAASVGEVNALLPLIEAINTTLPNQPLLLTTNTASSGEIARRRLPQGVEHAYLPVDWPRAVQHFLSQSQPRLGLIMETEIWPNLFRQCHQRKMPLIIINGRISKKTLKAPAWLRQLYRDSLHHTTKILTRSEEDKAGFIALGAESERCELLGNIKFAGVNSESPPSIELGRPYLLAASTRDEEEKLIVEAWQKSGRSELLVIAPRHPKRLEAILQDLKPYALEVAVRSRGEKPSATTQLYLADTFGELRGFMQGAELVFMGGSLVEKGGQNILEPAAQGKAVVTGPHMDNFSDETRTLLRHDGLQQVQSVDELADALCQLMAGNEKREALGARAKEAVSLQADVLERYLAALKPWL